MHLGLGLTLSGSTSGGAAPAALAVYSSDSAVGHYTDAGAGAVSAISEQGTFGVTLVQGTAANRPSATTVAGFITGDASNDYIGHPLVNATSGAATTVLPNGRGGGADTTLAAYAAWNVATAYSAPTTVATAFVVSPIDGLSYFNLTATTGEEPSVSPLAWRLANLAQFSVTHLNLNLAKGSGYLVGNDGRRLQGDGTTNKPSVVFVNEDFTKDTGYGNGVGDRAGELILSAYDGSSVQAVGIDRAVPTHARVLVVGTGLVRINHTSAVVSGTLSGDGWTSVNGCAFLLDDPSGTDPLGDGTAYVTCDLSGAGAATLTRRNAAGAILGTPVNTGVSGGFDSLWWWAEKRVIICTTATAAYLYSPYGVRCGLLPTETTNWSATFNRGEGGCVSWSGLNYLASHNGPYHQSAIPATVTPNTGVVVSFDLEASGVAGDTPVFEYHIRYYAASVVNTKAVVNFGDPISNYGGLGLWHDTADGAKPYRVYCNLKGGSGTPAQVATFTGSAPTSNRVVSIIWDGPGRYVEVLVDGVSLGQDTTTFTDFFGSGGSGGFQRVPYGMLSLMANPLPGGGTRNSSTRWKGHRGFATATRRTAGEIAATIAELQALT